MICQVLQSCNAAKIRQFTCTFFKIIPGSQPRTPALWYHIESGYPAPPPPLGCLPTPLKTSRFTEIVYLVEFTGFSERRFRDTSLQGTSSCCQKSVPCIF